MAYDGAYYIQELKNRTHTENSNIAEARYLEYLSMYHEKIIEEVKTYVEDANFFSVTITRNVNTGQYVYELDVVNSIDSVFIQYHSNTKPKKADSISLKTNPEVETELKENASEDNPKYDIVGNKLKIFPKGSEDVNEGITLYGGKTPWGITVESTEEEIFSGLLHNYRDVLLAGASARFYDVELKRYDEANLFYQRYNDSLKDMLEKLKERKNDPIPIEEDESILISLG